MPHYTIYHLSSNAETQVEFLGFDKANNTATCRYGLAGIYSFCLRSGQGKDDAKTWAIRDLESSRTPGRRTRRSGANHARRNHQPLTRDKPRWGGGLNGN